MYNDKVTKSIADAAMQVMLDEAGKFNADNWEQTADGKWKSKKGPTKISDNEYRKLSGKPAAPAAAARPANAFNKDDWKERRGSLDFDQKYRVNKNTGETMAKQKYDTLSNVKDPTNDKGERIEPDGTRTVDKIPKDSGYGSVSAAPAANAPKNDKPFVKKYNSQMQTGLSNKYTANKKSDADMIKRQDKDIVALSKQKDAPVSTAATAAGGAATPAATPAAARTAPAANPEVMRPGQTRSNGQIERLKQYEKGRKDREERARRVSPEPASEPGSEDNAQYKETETTPKKGFLDKVKDFASNLPGYHEKTGEQVGFDKDESGKYTRKYVGKRENSNILGIPEDYTLTFAGRVSTLVESSYSIKDADKESIIENIQYNFGDFFTEAKTKSSKSTVSKKLPSNKDLGIPDDESVKIIDRDSDLDQEHFKLSVNGKPVHFVHHNYEGGHATDSKQDIHYQVKNQLKHLSDADKKKVTDTVHASYRIKELDKRYITSKDDEEPSTPTNVKQAKTAMDEGKLDDYLDRKRLERDLTEPWDNPKKVKKTVKSLLQYPRKKQTSKK